MPPCCAVPQCSERTGGHKFPKDKVLVKKWLTAMRRGNFTPTEHSRICKKHFTSRDYSLPKDSIIAFPKPVLKKDAVPSIFAWTDASEIEQTLKENTQEAPDQAGKDSDDEFLRVNRNNDESCHTELTSKGETHSGKKNMGARSYVAKHRKNTNVAGKSSSFLKGNIIEDERERRLYKQFDDFNHFMVGSNLLGFKKAIPEQTKSDNTINLLL